MLLIDIDRNINKLILTTDDPTIHFFMESKKTQYQYIPWKKHWGYVDKKVKIYDSGRQVKGEGLLRYELGLGWASYLIGIFKDKMSAENYEYIIKNVILADNYRTIPFTELRDYQNDDVLFLLKYRLGLMQVNTGYGKTQTIATLTNYAHEVLGKKVLLVCPSNKARDELVKRCRTAFNLIVSCKEKDINGHLDCIITSGLTNSSKYKDPVEQEKFKQLLAQYEWVLVDEVEYTINAGGEFIYNNCIGAERLYGFSGTADKTAAETITFSQGLSDVIVRNKTLVKYFGPSLIYRMPLNISISNVKIKTKSLDNLTLDESRIEDSGNVYAEIMTQIWSNDDVCKTIVRIIEKYPLCFIPINNLVNILYVWIEKYFIGKFRVLLVCGEGYVYYDLQGNKYVLDLQEACEYIKKGLVDVIPSTSSGYRALDLPGLENICLFAGKVAGVTLQSIGRCARGKHMNIITIEPYSKKKIPVYSKGAQEREEMIKNYYQYCSIDDVVVFEEFL